MTVQRLGPFLIDKLSPEIRRFDYSRDKHGIGIVHLGIGAFHRAHQAVYTDTAIAAAGGDWRILGVSLRSPQVCELLNPQDGLYTVVESSEHGNNYRLIGSIKEALFAPPNAEQVLEALSHGSTKIISLTVTEKGYCHDPASGRLDLTNRDIVHDLATPGYPRSAVGFLAEALRRRRARNIPPPTILSCDNLPDNGSTLQRILLDFVGFAHPHLYDWIAGTVAFPSTMVDRIVPATTDDDVGAISQRLGVFDQALVKTEPFAQWVIEDWFADSRPMWEAGGALIVPDVRPFELAKIRLLNGTHSMCAYLGLLAGFAFVHDVMRLSSFQHLVGQMMASEIAPTLTPSSDLDIVAYQKTIISRLSNSTVKHRLDQIAMDGSQKLPQRLLGSLRARLALGYSIDLLSLAIAAWMQYATGRDLAGRSLVVNDPLAQTLRTVADRAGTDIEQLVSGFVGIKSIFGEDLIKSMTFLNTVSRQLHMLREHGALSTIGSVAPPLE